MAIKYDVVANTGKYTSAQGEEKNRYQKMGVVMETKTGSLMVKIEAIPVNWDGWAYLNTPKAKDGQQGGGQQAPFQDDDIPF